MRVRNLLILLGALVAVASAAGLALDLRPERPMAAPRVLDNYRARGELRVGAARVGFQVPAGGPVAGYPPPRPTARSSATPLQVRALVIEAGGEMLAIASAEVLEIPTELGDEVRRRARQMGLRDVVLTATHTHSGVGGYDANPLAQLAATGRYDAAARAAILDAVLDAVRDARNDREPARVRVGRASVGAALTANRAVRGGPVESELRTVEWVSSDEGRHPIARLVVFGAHPTLVAREAERYDGDYPSSAMRALEAEGAVAVFMQGAFGDVRARPPEGEAGSGAERMGQAVAAAARQAFAAARELEPEVHYAAAQVALPPAEAAGALPRVLRRAGANVLDGIMPERGAVAALEIGAGEGAERFIFVPAEPTVAAARAMRAGLGEWGEGAAVVGLANGYLGYLEVPERFADGGGESKRTLYGPELLERLEAGLEACVRSL